MQKEVTFLAHKVSEHGVSTKVTAVQDWSVPKSVSEQHSFLGLASYYCYFIAIFSTVAAHLTWLKNLRIEWGLTYNSRTFSKPDLLCHPERTIGCDRVCEPLQALTVWTEICSPNRSCLSQVVDIDLRTGRTSRKMD